ncbi:hypothetical protein E1B06_19940, partial [Brevibacillus laterosporus]|uniref:RHS repeat-associated core domain-containing protein n=1 Tax=Brevibacillus laterosporus TaxID=1465 RepID=UPI002406A467
YYYTNAHGDIVEIKDKAGQTLNKYEYDLWGNVESKQETMSNPFLYAGEIFDEESGLIYLRARYYDPNDGRFITEDTYKGQVDNPLSLNRYTYVHNNPVGNVDPTGNWCESKDGNWAHPGGCSSKSNKKSHDNDHSGDFIFENGKVIGAYKYDDGSGARELEGFEDPFTYLSLGGGIVKGIFKSSIKEIVKGSSKQVVQKSGEFLFKVDRQHFSSYVMKEVSELGSNKIKHIMDSKHAWSRIVNDPNDWTQVSVIMSRVMREGAE